MTDHALLQMIFSLEAQRTIELARLGRYSGAEARLESLDTTLDGALQELTSRGLRYPLHMVAAHYALTQADYLLLQLALLAHHSEPYLEQLTQALEAPAESPLLSHALALLTPDHDDWARARKSLSDLTVFKEKLISLTPPEAEDPRLALSLSLLELLGLNED